MPDQERQPHSELASFGEELRREREIRGISLKEISDATKISKRFLEAIERNDHKTLPAPVFTRGFVREYARYLGLNAEDMVSRYNYAAAGDDRIEKSLHLERLVEAQQNPQQTADDRAARPRGIPPAYARIDRNVYVTAIIIAALLGLSFWAFRHKQAKSEETVAQAEAAPAAAAAPHPAAKPAAPVTASTPPAPADGMLHLTVDLNADSWVILEADGRTVFNDEMRKGDHRTFDAKERFRFRTIGYAPGVELMLNDRKLPAFGHDHNVIHDKVLDHDTLQGLGAEQPRNET